MLKLSDLRSDHRTALRSAWLDLCHAHAALVHREPVLAEALCTLITQLTTRYPELPATLRKTHPDEMED